MAGTRNKYELADVVRKFGKSLIEHDRLSPGQTKALFHILRCRTASLGGHEEECDHSKANRYSYNSCGDRHCRKCQGAKQAIWIEDLQEATLPVKHYHIIFTVPYCLNDICLWDQRMYYNILFIAVWQTLYSFGYTHYGAETGAVAVLHPWGQNLSLHPHIHCIVPAAGYSLKGEWKSIGRNARYLGQYTHRVAISNHRIINITDTRVTFIAKDYRDRATKKPVTLKGTEFLRRFCLHVFPKRFVRIRRYGIYNATTIRNLDLQFVPEKKPDIEQLANPKKEETSAERIKRLTGFDMGLCPVCNKGRMRVVRGIPRIRSPAAHLPTILLSLLN